MTNPADTLYDDIRDLPIVSPHGHCDPAWFASDAKWTTPTDLILTPDHYLYRMLYSQGVSMQEMGIGVPADQKDPRQIWRLFAAKYHLFLGTPSHTWLRYMFNNTFAIDQPLTPASADAIYDQIAASLASDAFRPRAVFERFNIAALATTDAATDPLVHHHAIAASGWTGRVIPTFRPDAVLDPMDDRFASSISDLAQITNCDTATFEGYLQALMAQRAAFAALGATATDHAAEVLYTCWLDDPATYYAKALDGTITRAEAAQFQGHMLVQMARFSCDDGLVMQLHVGSKRNTNKALFESLGRDVGADIPVATDWVHGLQCLLDHCGNHPNFTLILFTLDEATYARELAPMAGHWPCLRIGPPWWFHDSAAGIARYFDQVVETAGYWNLAGFNDDTRAFMSIPARHDVWRRGVAQHLGAQVQAKVFDLSDARSLAPLLATQIAAQTYRL
ncbi:glucuronate isomerase [Algirhabdus cladophorae]|uniref:glucuronate isomerase n=1 Tax=Algirhabdus cladophorae TaxID=3377108 RepID=UPI003B847F03